MTTLLDKLKPYKFHIMSLLIAAIIVIIVAVIIVVIISVKNKKKSTQSFMESFDVGNSLSKNWSDSKAGISEFVDSWKNVVKKAYTSDVNQQQKQQTFKQNFGQGLIQDVKQKTKKAYNQIIDQTKQDLNEIKQETIKQFQQLKQPQQPQQNETFVSKRSTYGNATRKYRLASGQNVIGDQSYLNKQQQQLREGFVAPRQSYGPVERRYKQAQVFSNNEGYQESRVKKDFSNQTYLNNMSVKTGVNYKY